MDGSIGCMRIGIWRAKDEDERWNDGVMDWWMDVLLDWVDGCLDYVCMGGCIDGLMY